jgi:hypothetical protein
MKASGVAREGGTEALHFFTEAKNICIGIMTSGITSEVGTRL